MNNQNNTTAESPFDIVNVFEMPNESTRPPRPVPLYRRHRDEVDAYKNSRVVPGGFVFAILRDSLLQTLASAESFRELEGLPGLVRYMLASLPEDAYGSPEKVAAHIRGGTLTPGTPEA